MATYQVGADGKAQKGLKVGDQVVTAGGTYTITGVNADGSYQSSLTNKGQTTKTYSGNYDSTPSVVGTSGGTGGTDYHQQAIDAAKNGDWNSVYSALDEREKKTTATGENYGKTSQQILQELYDQYGTPEQQQTQFPSFEDFLEESGYGDYSEQTQAVIQAAVQQAINSYNDQISTTNQDTERLARQAYIAKMLGQKNLDQQLSASGYAGGMADSQRIANETNYQNELNDLELQRQQTVKELESAITNARLTGDMQTAQELGSYLQQIQSQWNAYVQNQQTLANENYWNQQSLNLQESSTAYSQAMDMLERGYMPSDTMLNAAGILKSDAQARLTQAQTGLTPQTTETPASKKNYNNGSLTTAQVKQLQQALGVTADGLWGSASKAAAGGLTADEAWQMYSENQQVQTQPWSAVTYSSFLSRGDYSGADNYLEKYWDTLSEEQKGTVERLISAYGLA